MKDTLRIEFHRPDRTYRSGEPVRGELVIHTDRGESCGSVHLMRYWRTHGKGNSDRGDRKVMLLHEGPLEGPPPYRVPFEFEAPGGPFTYHGSYVNVDHYVEARVDLPGLFDPGPAEEFVLVPGAQVDPPHPDLLKVTGKRAANVKGCRVVIGAAMVLFGFFTLPIGLVLLVPGLFLAIPGMTRWLAGSRIGEVNSGADGMVVTPGGTLQMKVRLKPRKARSINAATAVLRGQEIVVSGKGSDRKVHMHEIHSREFQLSGPRQLTPGQPAVLEAEIEVPDRPAYTFTSKHNEVTWDVQVSVDIPSWPDWHQEHKLVVWAVKPGRRTATKALPDEDVMAALPTGTPREEGTPGEERKTRAVTSRSSRPHSRRNEREREREKKSDRGRGSGTREAGKTSRKKVAPSTEAPMEQRPPVEPPTPEPSPEPVPEPVPEPISRAPGAEPEENVSERTSPASDDLAARIAAILELKSFGGARDPLIRDLKGESFTFDLEVDLVKHTFGAGPDPVYRHGRTVTGVVAGTRFDVEVRFPADRNEDVDRYRRGAVRTVTATVVDWEKLSEKPALEA